MDNPYEIYLRALKIEDARISYRWRNDPEIWKNTGSAPDRFVTEEMETEWLRKTLVDNSIRRYAICLRADDRYIGNVYLSDMANGSAEEQIFIGDSAFWGHGIGTAARAALCKIASTELGLTRIESRIRTRNIASIKSVLKLGFTEMSRDEEWVKFEKRLRG